LGPAFLFDTNLITANAMKRLLLNIALGQVLSICLTLTNTSTSLLWLYFNVNVPPLQNLLNYVLLFGVYTAVHIRKHGVEAWKLMLRERAWKCKIKRGKVIYISIVSLTLAAKDILFAMADVQGQLHCFSGI
jgi:hypothetical protein